MQESLRRLVRLQDLDLMIEASVKPGKQAAERPRARAVGDVASLEQARKDLAKTIDAAVVATYERVRRRHQRAVVGLRGGICLGCYMRCPTAFVPRAASVLSTCQRCGRILAPANEPAPAPEPQPEPVAPEAKRPARRARSASVESRRSAGAR